MRTPVVAGNWKMNLGRADALVLARAYVELARNTKSVEIAVFPGMLVAGEIAREAANTPLRVGAQNCCAEASGAFTGEVAPGQILDAGIASVLLGHSERRHTFGETDELIARKLALAAATGLHVMLCVGELAAERDAGRERDAVSRQLEALRGLPGGQRAHLDVAYEPVWAIGTGRNATPAQAGEMHRFIRQRLDDLGGYAASRILYGGSVNTGNCAPLAAQPDIEGFLVGGAALNIENFHEIAASMAARSADH